MTVPLHHELYDTILATACGKEIGYAEAISKIIEKFSLSEEDVSTQMQSGGSLLKNRVAWAVTYLSKADLMVRTGTGLFRTTPKGEKLVREGVAVDQKHLMESEKFRQFMQPSNNKKSKKSNDKGFISKTPEDEIEDAFNSISSELESQLAERLKQISPTYFEQLIIDLLLAMGYGGGPNLIAQRVGKSGDGGIDGVINEDPLGLEVVYIQAKRYSTNIGEPELRNFVGSLDDKRTSKGVFVTTSDFTPAALSYAERSTKRLILINGIQLVRYMVKNNIGVRVAKKLEIKKIDEQYFEE